MWKKLLLVVVSLIFGLFITELLIRTFSPQRILYPKWNLVNVVGRENIAEAVMVHSGPGWEYEYSINSLGHRGDTLLSKIWCIGDSYTFGYGVDTAYADYIGAVNMGVGGDGLPQETSRFLTYMQRYSYAPEVCILQFCANDIFNDPYLRYDPDPPTDLQQWIANSELLQTSHVYKLATSIIMNPQNYSNNDTPVAVAAYCAMLDTFSLYLDHNNIRLLFIDVNRQSFQFPILRGMMDSTYIEYIDTGMQDPSPEGHAWGQQAHRNVADSLRKVL